MKKNDLTPDTPPEEVRINIFNKIKINESFSLHLDLFRWYDRLLKRWDAK